MTLRVAILAGTIFCLSAGMISEENSITEKEREGIFFGQIDSLDQRLVGDWGIYEAGTNGSGWLCNVCPKLIIEESGDFELELPNGDIQKLKGTTRSDTLFLEIQSQKKTEVYLSAKFYYMEFEQKQEYLELALYSENGDYNLLRK